MIALRTIGNRCSRSPPGGGYLAGAGARGRAGTLGRRTRGLGIELLGDIRDVFEKRSVQRISSEDLVLALVGLEERPWAEYSGGKSVTKAKLARLLSPFGVVSRTIRLPDGRTPKDICWSSSPTPLLDPSPRKRNNATTYAGRGFPTIATAGGCGASEKWPRT